VRAPENPPTTARARAGHVDSASIATLAAVAAVVVLVSLSSLRGFTLRQNELDAQRTVRLLGQLAADEPEAPRAIGALVREHPGAARQLQDHELLYDGALLRRHGYLFDVQWSPAGASVRAWPWRHGRTGHGAYVCDAGRRIVGHPNDDGRWSGPEGAPTLPWDGRGGWRELR